MNILMSIHKQFATMITDGTKPIEFRTRLPKDLKKNDIIYIYETSKNNGCKKVVGQCEVDYIIPVLNEEGKWPIYGAYPFIDFFFEHIKGDKETAQMYKKLKEEFDTYENYRYGFILGYALSELELKHLRETGSLINTWKIGDFDLVKKIVDANTESNDAIGECDKWLSKIGFYDDTDESYYKYGIVLKNPQKYATPKDLTDFVNQNGNKITKPPQSWMYANLNQ